MYSLQLIVAGLLAAISSVSHAGESVRLLAAGSLRAPATEIARLFEAREGLQVQAKFGASGLLRDEITTKGQADVFASANMFTRNRMCLLVRPGFDLARTAVVERMLNPVIKL